MPWDEFHQIEASQSSFVTLSHIYSGRETISTAMNCITMHKPTEMCSEPDIQNLDNLRPETERSSLRRRTRNGMPTVKPLHLLLAPFMNSTDTSTVCRDYVKLFSMNVNLKVFCILRKASENLTFISFISIVWAR